MQAVAARDGYRAKLLADECGAPSSYGEYRPLCDDRNIDVVYVATTHGQHYSQVRELLDAGKPVLVEKSFTLNADQASALMQLACERDVFCMEAVWTRCLPTVREAISVARSDIGRVVGVRSDLSRYVPYDPSHRLWNPLTGGGALLDIGVYVAHLGWAFLGEPTTIQTVGRLEANGVDACAAMQWGYADGRCAQLSASFDGVTDDPHTVVSGQDGWISLYGRTHDPLRVVIHTGGTEREITGSHLGNGYRPQIAEVERALRAGDLQSPLVPLADTVGVLRALDAARAELGVHYGQLEEC